MPFETRSAAAILAAFGLGLGAPAALAQEQEMQTQPPAQTQSPAQAQDLSDEKLESFTLAALDVQEVQVQYGPEIEAATNEEEKRRIINQAMDEMVAVVEATPGISVDEYNAIAQAIAADPALAAEVQEKVQELAGQ